VKEYRVAHIDTQATWRGGERQAIELIKGLNAKEIRNILVCKPGSEISRHAGRESIEVRHLPLRGEWDFISMYRLRSILVSESINIVHAHTSHGHMIGLMAKTGLPACRLVVSRRVDFHVNNLFSRTFKYGAGVDKILAVSDAIKRVLIEDGIPESRVETVRSGFVPHEFISRGQSENIREKLGISPETTVIATVAALAPHKALHVLLKAASIVCQKRKDVVFLIAGEGELRPVMEKNIDSLLLGKSVILLGFIDDIGSVYESADIFCLSSREEGLCTSILDAMYFGLPIVSTNAGGIPELVNNSVNGLIVPVDNHQLLAERLLELVDDPALRKEMGERGTTLLEQNKMEQTVDKTFLVYKSLIEDR